MFKWNRLHKQFIFGFWADLFTVTEQRYERGVSSAGYSTRYNQTTPRQTTRI